MLSFFCFYFIAITQGNFFTWVPSVQSLFEAMTWLLSLNDSKKMFSSIAIQLNINIPFTPKSD